MPGSSELQNCHKPFAISLSEQRVEHEVGETTRRFLSFFVPRKGDPNWYRLGSLTARLPGRESSDKETRKIDKSGFLGRIQMACISP